jgi:hypothetical protein
LQAAKRAFRPQCNHGTSASMEPVLLGMALGAGAIYLAKRGRKVTHSAVGWTARKTGWIAGRVRSSLDEARAVARAQYERGRQEASTTPAISAPSKGNGSANTSSATPSS